MDLCTVTGIFYNADGTPAEDLAVTFRLSPNSYTATEHNLTTTVTETTNASGVVTAILIVGARYAVQATNQKAFPIIIPDAATATLESLHASLDSGSPDIDAVQTAIQAALTLYVTLGVYNAAIALLQAADATLTANLAAEVTNRTNADTSLSNAIAAEQAARQAADTTLQADINTRLTQAAGDARYLQLSDRRQLQTWTILHGSSTVTTNPVNADTEFGTLPRARYHVDLRPYTHMRVRAYCSANTGTNAIKVRHSPTNSTIGGSMFSFVNDVSQNLTAAQWNESAWIPLDAADRIETWLIPILNGSGGSVGLTSFHIDVTSKT